MRRGLRLMAPLVAALVLVPAATAATPGTYRGHLLAKDGDRIKRATVTATVRGNRLTLDARNLRATCPYLDDDGKLTRLRVNLSWTGNVVGNRVDGIAPVEGGNNVLVLRGRFSGRRFSGRLSLRPAEGVTGACSGSHRLIAYRARR